MLPLFLIDLKVYFYWIDNLRDWCISRQIWWGHRIPVWYHKTSGETFVGVQAPEGEDWEQDEDTLDTWFSSATYHFLFLVGRQNRRSGTILSHRCTRNRTRYSLLLGCTHDYVWTIRNRKISISYGLSPWTRLRCERTKMSKSKGNGIDPLDVIEQFGTDALRLSLIMGTTPGIMPIWEKKNLRMPKLLQKLWNISRFLLEQETGNSPKLQKPIFKMDFFPKEILLSKRLRTILNIFDLVMSHKNSGNLLGTIWQTGQ